MFQQFKFGEVISLLLSWEITFYDTELKSAGQLSCGISALGAVLYKQHLNMTLH